MFITKERALAIVNKIKSSTVADEHKALVIGFRDILQNALNTNDSFIKVNDAGLAKVEAALDTAVEAPVAPIVEEVKPPVKKTEEVKKAAADAVKKAGEAFTWAQQQMRENIQVLGKRRPGDPKNPRG